MSEEPYSNNSSSTKSDSCCSGWSDCEFQDDDECGLSLATLDLLRHISEESVREFESEVNLHSEDTESSLHADNYFPEDLVESWNEEVQAAQSILGHDDVSIKFKESGPNVITLNLEPYCGEYHLFRPVTVRCVFRPTEYYPNECPEFRIISSTGLNPAELLSLESVMVSAHARESGTPCLYSMVDSARELLTQRATFVTKKEFCEKIVDSDEEKSNDKKKKSKPHPTIPPDNKTPGVFFDSWPVDKSILKFLPSAKMLSSLLSAAAPHWQWRVSSVASHWLTERFLKCSTRLKSQCEVVFHGTSMLNNQSIIDHGLLVPGMKSENDGKRVIGIINGAAYGHGIYCSPCMSTARCYSSGSVFVCLFAPGKKNSISSKCSTAQKSGFNSNAFGNVYVGFEAAQVLPCLLISYKAEYAYRQPRINIAQTIVRLVVDFDDQTTPNISQRKKRGWRKSTR
eukprot:131463_1